MINSISVIGYRGFAEEQKIDLAIPNGKPGSGLTVIVGPNGGGKSTLVECFHKLDQNNTSFTSGKRNKKAGDKVTITIQHDGDISVLSTTKTGGSEAEWNAGKRPNVYYLPARRVFSPYFGKNPWGRDTYIRNYQGSQYRASTLDNFSSRLFDIIKKPDDFNTLFWSILGYQLEWTIDQDDNGSYFVKVKKNPDTYHNSDGLGEGIVSLLFLADAIYEAKTDELVVIDEPELSLHPQLQMRLLQAILNITSSIQVVIATHSPSMISCKSIANGGNVVRVYEVNSSSVASAIDDRCRNYIASSMRNINNPHIFGSDARSCFFAEDGYIITEGQEDVMLYPYLVNQLGLDINIPFFGFGAGGASGIKEVAHLFQCLGFNNIGAIYDGDKRDEYEEFQSEFSPYGYKAWIIPADDVRDKVARNIVAKNGLLDESRSLKAKYKDEISRIITEIDDFIHPKE